MNFALGKKQERINRKKKVIIRKFHYLTDLVESLFVSPFHFFFLLMKFGRHVKHIKEISKLFRLEYKAIHFQTVSHLRNERPCINSYTEYNGATLQKHMSHVMYKAVFRSTLIADSVQWLMTMCVLYVQGVYKVQQNLDYFN